MARKIIFSALIASVLAWGVGLEEATATQFRSGSVVSVRDAEILDDVFAAGDDLSFEGHILGDVFAAGQTIALGDSAVVDNSFMAIGQKVDVNGTVINSARAFAQDFTLRGHVERNVMGFAQSILIDSRAWVEKDVNFGCGQLIVRGHIGGNLTGGASNITISGQIDGDVKIEGDKIVVLQGAIIGGSLKYTSDKEAKIEDGAQILGGVERVSEKDSDKDDKGYTLGSFFWDAWGYLSSLAIGALMLVLFRPFMLSASESVTRSFGRTIGLGALFLICLPIAAVAICLTLIGIPAAILIILLWMVLIFLSDIFIGLALGDWLLRFMRKGVTPRPFIALSFGLLVITILCGLPMIGTLIGVVVAALAMGAFFISAHKYRTKPEVPLS